jgi:isoquinoline 1-oxidoreductase beta subunit
LVSNEITRTGGEVDRFDQPDYKPLRRQDTAAVEAHFLPVPTPSAAVKPGRPPAEPAQGSVIAAADDVPVTALLMTRHAVALV